MNVRDFAIVVNPYDRHYGCKVQIIAVQTDFDGRITGYTACTSHNSAGNGPPQKTRRQESCVQAHLKDYPAVDLHYCSCNFRGKLYSQMQLL